MTLPHGWMPEDLADYKAAQEAHRHVTTIRHDVKVTQADPGSEVDALRAAENDKLDRMESPLWRTLTDPNANSGQVSQAVYAILKVMERRAKLNGLDLTTGAHVTFSQIEIVYKDKASGAVIDAPEWVTHDADHR